MINILKMKNEHQYSNITIWKSPSYQVTVTCDSVWGNVSCSHSLPQRHFTAFNWKNYHLWPLIPFHRTPSSVLHLSVNFGTSSWKSPLWSFSPPSSILLPMNSLLQTNYGTWKSRLPFNGIFLCLYDVDILMCCAALMCTTHKVLSTYCQHTANRMKVESRTSTLTPTPDQWVEKLSLQEDSL